MPRAVEVEYPAVRVFGLQEVGPFAFLPFRVRLGVLQPSPPGFVQVIPQHPGRCFGHRRKRAFIAFVSCQPGPQQFRQVLPYRLHVKPASL
ncbi:MAG TPA: hypothetical protein PLF81_00185, partial [Candidatus Anammoximicrobium sp.]|nr:hypothetical protein [Candidatus Anammoximicrobium sp.]